MGFIGNILNSFNGGSYDHRTETYTPFRNSSKKGNLLKLGYEDNVDAYSVVKKIVDTSKSVSWIVEEKTVNGWELKEDNTIIDLLEAPNNSKQYTFQDIQEQFLTYLLCSGNAYLFGEKLDEGIIKELDVLPSNHVEIKCDESFFLSNIKYNFSLGETKYTFDIEDLAHVKLFNPSFTSVNESLYGLSAFQVASNVITVGNDKWEADSHLLKNRGIAGIISDESERPMTPEEAKAAQTSFDKESNGTSRFGRVRVTNKKLKYLQMGMSSTDLELIKKGVITLRAMCNVFGLDSGLFNDPEGKKYSNKQEAEKALYTNAVIPLSNKVAAAFTQYICYNHYPDKNVRMRQDFSRIESLQKDKNEEAKKDKTTMEGVNIVLNMPISNEGKKALLLDDYKMNEDKVNAILKENTNVPD